MRERIGIALDQTRDAALPGGEAELAGAPRTVLPKRDGAVGRVDVGREIARARDTFERQEAAGCEGQTFVAESLFRAGHEGRQGTVAIDLVSDRLGGRPCGSLLRRGSLLIGVFPARLLIDFGFQAVQLGFENRYLGRSRSVCVYRRSIDCRNEA